MSEISELEARLKDVISNTCNKSGCDNCDLKWDESCSANELQTQIMEIELKQPTGEGA